MELPDPSAYPLCSYFLLGYLSKGEDADNFPPDEIPDLFERYEKLFGRLAQSKALRSDFCETLPAPWHKRPDLLSLVGQELKLSACHFERRRAFRRREKSRSEHVHAEGV